MRPQYRQGDVFLFEVEQLPTGAQEETGLDRIVLAYGEVTGHSHSVSRNEAKMYHHGDESYLVVETNAKVIHEEHDSIALRAGFYKVIRQREYEPIRGTEFVSD